MNQSGRKILAINGGPHKSGVTASMLQIAVEECRRKGDEVTEINLYDMKIRYCLGCRCCLETRECVMRDDDIAELTKRVKACDMIILATPVYWANVPAAVKNLFDRLLGVSMEETDKFPKPRLEGKEYLVLCACNTPMPFAAWCGQSTGAKRAIVEYFKTSGMKKRGFIVKANTGVNKAISDRLAAKIRKRV